jgi:hypothetical protein
VRTRHQAGGYHHCHTGLAALGSILSDLNVLLFYPEFGCQYFADAALKEAASSVHDRVWIQRKMNRFLVAECRQSWNGFVSKAIALLPTIEWNFLHRNSTDIERYHKGYMMRYVAALYTLGTACRTVRRVGGIVKLSDCRLDATDGSNTTKQTHPIIMEGETRRYVKVVKTHCL